MNLSFGHSVFLFFLILCSGLKAQAQFPFTNTTPTYTQNFNSFNGTFAGLPQYWTILTQPSIAQRVDGCGSDNAGGLWSYYSSSSERALGYLPSASSDTFLAQVTFVNNTSNVITSLRVSYNFETWRRLSSGRTNGFTVSTNIPGANVSSLSHSQAPSGMSTCTQLSTLKSLVLNNLSVLPGQTFYFRWGGGRGTSSGASNGIGIDNVTIEILCPPQTINKDTSICFGSSFIDSKLNTYTSSQTFFDTLQTAAGCDSIVHYNLTILPLITQTVDTAICSGQSLVFNNQTYTTSQTGLKDTFTNANGCDSVVTLNLTVNPVYQHTLNESICQGQSYTFNGNVYTATQHGIVGNFQTIKGCDSIVTLNLTVQPLPTLVLNKTICEGESFTHNGITYTTSQTGITTFYPVPGSCDSQVVFNLNVLPVNPLTQTEMIRACFEVQYRGMTFYRDTVIRDTLYNQSGCDSIYHIATIEVFNRPPSVMYTDTTACGELWFNGNLYTQNTTVIDTLKNSTGCDSAIVHTAIYIEHIDMFLSIEDPHDPYEGESFLLRADNRENQGFYVTQWLPEHIFDQDKRLNYQRLSLNGPETLMVIATTPAGCMDTAVLLVEPREYNKNMVIPNAFTPNGDGKNDVFRPFINLDRAYSIIDFKVYNRYGQVIHASAHSSQGWDGSFNGKVQDNGVYQYIIRIRFIDGTEKQFKGDVTLIR